MPPIVADYIGAIIRWGLVWLLGYLVKQGIVDQATTTAMVTFLTGSILVLLWSLYQKYAAKRVQLVAQTMPAGSTEDDVHEKIAASKAVGVPLPSVMTASDAKPTT